MPPPYPAFHSGAVRRFPGGGPRKETAFDLVFADTSMPGGGAFDLLDDLGPAAPPVVAMVLASQPEEIARSRARGAAGCLLKPMRRSELHQLVLSAGLLGKPAGQPGEVRAGVPPTGYATETAKRIRVLLAEDNIINQKFAVRLLEDLGHTVVVAPDGMKALAALHNQSFDLVLMDMQMPGMDGIETTHEIRKIEQGVREGSLVPELQSALHGARRGGRIPIVAMTANAMLEDRDRCLAAGMDEHIAKPVEISDLERVIREVGNGTLLKRVPALPVAGMSPIEPIAVGW